MITSDRDRDLDMCTFRRMITSDRDRDLDMCTCRRMITSELVGLSPAVRLYKIQKLVHETMVRMCPVPLTFKKGDVIYQS